MNYNDLSILIMLDYGRISQLYFLPLQSDQFYHGIFKKTMRFYIEITSRSSIQKYWTGLNKHFGHCVVCLSSIYGF
jgi:hypothetical protein